MEHYLYRRQTVRQHRSDEDSTESKALSERDHYCRGECLDIYNNAAIATCRTTTTVPTTTINEDDRTIVDDET